MHCAKGVEMKISIWSQLLMCELPAWNIRPPGAQKVLRGECWNKTCSCVLAPCKLTINQHIASCWCNILALLKSIMSNTHTYEQRRTTHVLRLPFYPIPARFTACRCLSGVLCLRGRLARATKQLLTADCISLVWTVGALGLSVAAPASGDALSVLAGEVRGSARLLRCGDRRKGKHGGYFMGERNAVLQ